MSNWFVDWVKVLRDPSNPLDVLTRSMRVVKSPIAGNISDVANEQKVPNPLLPPSRRGGRASVTGAGTGVIHVIDPVLLPN